MIYVCVCICVKRMGEKDFNDTNMFKLLKH